MDRRVFLCHSSVDKEQVRELYRRLQRDGFQPWLDEEDILPGQDWEREIRRAIRKSRYVLVCLSKRSVSTRGFVHKEITHALDVADQQPDGSIFLIPVRLERCEVPDRLGRPQWVDLFEAGGYGRLLLSLRRMDDVSPAATVSGSSDVQIGASAESPPHPTDDASPAHVTPSAVRAGASAKGPSDGRARFRSWRRRKRKPILLVTATALAMTTVAVTTIVLLSSRADKNTATPSDGAAGYPFTAPGLAISPDGQWLYVTINRIPSSANQADLFGSLVAIDTQTRVTGRPMEITPGVGDAVIGPGGEPLYVATHISGEGVAVIFKLGANPIGIGGIDLTGSSSKGNRSLALSLNPPMNDRFG